MQKSMKSMPGSPGKLGRPYSRFNRFVILICIEHCFLDWLPAELHSV